MLVFRCMLDGRIKEMSTSTYSHPSVCVCVSVDAEQLMGNAVHT